MKVYCVKCRHRGPGRLVVSKEFQALHPARHKAVSGGAWCTGHLEPGVSKRPPRET